MTQDHAISLWDASAIEQDYHAPMEVDSAVDVSIAGGVLQAFRLRCIAIERGFPRIFKDRRKSVSVDPAVIAGW